ncbi:MAG: 50S ribosomal protein L21 [Gaiellales bacterium]|nr:50S ribosomal protein L21 [Gaiellales bacterium]
MFAIVDIGGKQYRAEEGCQLVVDRFDAAEGSTVELKPVLVKADDGLRLEAGDTKVTATVVEHLRGPRLVVFKYKPKRGYRRKNGFRSALTRLAVEKIG